MKTLLLIGGETRDQKTGTQQFPIFSSAVNNAPSFVNPARIVVTEDLPFSVVQNISVDGNFVITASMDGVLRLYDSRDGDFIRRFEGHQDPVNSVFITTDDAFVISGAGKFDSLWKSKSTLNGDDTDNSIRIWDLTTGKQILKLPVQKGVTCHYLGVSVVTSNQAGTIVVSGGFDKAVCLWDRSTGKLLTKFGGIAQETTANGTSYVETNSYHAGPVTAVGTFTLPSESRISLLQRAVSCSDDCSCRIWDIGMDSLTAFTELACIGPSTARCRQPNPLAHTQPVTCMSIMSMPRGLQVLITGE
jgi:WD40 repeat protein